MIGICYTFQFCRIPPFLARSQALPGNAYIEALPRCRKLEAEPLDRRSQAGAWEREDFNSAKV
jgi:hypothetical protein